jgi:hypothetical protein
MIFTLFGLGQLQSSALHRIISHIFTRCRCRMIPMSSLLIKEILKFSRFAQHDFHAMSDLQLMGLCTQHYIHILSRRIIPLCSHILKLVYSHAVKLSRSRIIPGFISSHWFHTRFCRIIPCEQFSVNKLSFTSSEAVAEREG